MSKHVDMNFCKCGCGKLVKQNYAKGHGRKGKKNSVKHREAISKATKGRKLPPERIEHLRLINTGRKRSPEEKEKLSRIAKEKGFGKWMKGRTPPLEIRQKISAATLGREVTADTRMKISKANSGQNNGMSDKTHTQEARQKISAAAKLQWQTNRDGILRAMNAPENIEKLRTARSKMVFPLKNTIPEICLASLLKDLSIEFEQHKLIDCGTHKYQCDFYIESYNMVIEVDGIYWHNYPHLRPIDICRSESIEKTGMKILRLWEHEVDRLDLNLLMQILSNMDKSIISTIPITEKYKRFIKKYGLL